MRSLLPLWACVAFAAPLSIGQQVHLVDGIRHATIDSAYVRAVIDAEIAARGDDATPHLAAARNVFEQVALADRFDDFLTLPAYELLP